MKSVSFFSALLIVAAFASGAEALGNDARDTAQPKFGDPGGQNPSRYVAPPGGEPYYDPSYQPLSPPPQAAVPVDTQGTARKCQLCE